MNYNIVNWYSKKNMDKTQQNNEEQKQENNNAVTILAQRFLEIKKKFKEEYPDKTEENKIKKYILFTKEAYAYRDKEQGQSKKSELDIASGIEPTIRKKIKKEQNVNLTQIQEYIDLSMAKLAAETSKKFNTIATTINKIEERYNDNIEICQKNMHTIFEKINKIEKYKIDLLAINKDERFREETNLPLFNEKPHQINTQKTKDSHVSEIVYLILAQLPCPDEKKDEYEKYITNAKTIIKPCIKELQPNTQYTLLEFVKQKNVNIMVFFIQSILCSECLRYTLETTIKEEVGEITRSSRQNQNLTGNLTHFITSSIEKKPLALHQKDEKYMEAIQGDSHALVAYQEQQAQELVLYEKTTQIKSILKSIFSVNFNKEKVNRQLLRESFYTNTFNA